MSQKKRIRKILSGCIGAVLLTIMISFIFCSNNPWGFARTVPDAEKRERMEFVRCAEKYLGYNEENDSHRIFIDIYNSADPLPQGYIMSYEDSWCAAFVSAVSIQCNMTDIIPVECGCERQIDLFQNFGRWQEQDGYTPLPGDIIYYAWDEKFLFGDCHGWSDHVGIVVGTVGPFMKIIEGNKDDQVGYRYIFNNHWDIRGYGLPDYSARSA